MEDENGKTGWTVVCISLPHVPQAVGLSVRTHHPTREGCSRDKVNHHRMKNGSRDPSPEGSTPECQTTCFPERERIVLQDLSRKLLIQNRDRQDWKSSEADVEELIRWILERKTEGKR